MWSNFKYILRNIDKEKKRLIIVVATIILCSIAITLGIYAQVTNAKIINIEKNDKTEIYKNLKINFNNIFTNSVNKRGISDIEGINYDEIIHCAYDITENKSSKYNVSVKIPMFKLETDTTTKINEEIFNTFASKTVNIVKSAATYTIYNIDYVGYINNNIVSLVIRCTLKDGSNPQRIIIKTYNYDIEKDKLLTIDDVINNKKINREDLQNTINSEIKSKSEETEAINTEGYNVYKRNYNNEMYKLENTKNFFLGENDYLYIIYSYGENSYTSEMDIIISE